MSDQTLAFIDPLETHFEVNRRSTSGYKFNLQEDAENFNLFCDQFAPYRHILPDDRDGIAEAVFHGTLFRFPLRQTPSELSNKTYTDETKIDELLRAFHVDAGITLLFLRSVDDIAVLKRRMDSDNKHAVLVHVTAEIESESQKLTLAKKERFFALLKEYCRTDRGRQNIEFTHVTVVTTTDEQSSSKQRWIVSHFIEGDNHGTDLSAMAKEQSFLPWTGVAIPIGQQEGNQDTLADTFSGRVFCFLPLPPSEESKTGLPVHIHGFFGINSDRRGIKWPGPDQTDAPAIWNKLLVSELLSKVYVKAILFAISMQVSDQNVTVHDVYSAWPDAEKILGNWGVLLEPFFGRLFQEKIIYTENKGWMKVSNVFFNTLSLESDMETAILKCLSRDNISCATVPELCMRSIEKYYKQKIATISQSLLCRCLSRNPSIVPSLTKEERLLVLEFILLNNVSVAELDGLDLLPLDDGSFTTFNASGSPVYIPTDTFRRELVPGAHRQFVGNLQQKPRLAELLGKLAQSSSCRFQVQLLTLPAIACLLKHHADDKSPPPNWLELIWTSLYKESPDSLTSFEGIPLIPVSGNHETKRLLSLQKSAIIVQRDLHVARLDQTTELVLNEIGATITDCPPYILRHPALFRNGYVQEPTPNGIVKLLMLLMKQGTDTRSLNVKISRLPRHTRQTLKNWLSKASLGPKEKIQLRKLKIFDRLKGTRIMTAEDIVNAECCLGFLDCADKDVPKPLKLTATVIDAMSEDETLLKNLSVRRISRYDIVTEVITELSQKNPSFYSTDETREILWILQRWHELRNYCKSCETILRNLKFVSTESGKLMSPAKLLDPQDQTLVDLFANQGLFPNGSFSETSELRSLRLLGMRGQDKLTADELVECVDSIEDQMCPSNARKFLALLRKNQHLISVSVSHYMKNKRCIPRMISPPEYYPSSMKWSDAPSLVTPSETFLSSKGTVLICGASVPFAKADEDTFEVFKHLGITHQRCPETQYVVNQLAICVNVTKEAERRDFSDLIHMVREIYSFLSTKRDNLDIVSRLEECIWNGNGFSAPHKMCTHELPFDISPYVTSVPQGMSDFTELFVALGVRSNFNTDANALVHVLHEIKRTCDESEDSALHERHLRLVFEILRHLYSNKSTSQEVTDQLLVPSRRQGCHLIPASKGAYIDREWLKQSIQDTDDVTDTEDFTLINPDVSVDLAEFLKVPPLSRLLLADDFQGFTQTGQHEPLTVRLSNILKNTYSDPTTIFKEMIQNAEDSEAQEVCFLIDMRKNDCAKEKLFDPGMRDCQGPALWVYNDAVFSDEDFINITRLGGRTKERDATKVGKFGTGFNSVYHITDVPCFVSRHYIQYFDPHTTHLGKILRDKTQPGVRVKLDGSSQFQRFPDQFVPFEGLFGFRMSDNFDFRGTLFRLPLRSKQSARKSEICMESYDLERVTKMMGHLWKIAENLLVFTRNVKRVSVSSLDERQHDASIPQKLMEINKSSHPSRDKGDGLSVSTETYSCLLTDLGKRVLGNNCSTTEQKFDVLKLTCMGSDRATKIAHSEKGREHGLSTEGSVAIPLLQKELSQINGEIFCYLSLSIGSMLPCHINGSFAVTEDRQGLANVQFLKNWNEVILTDVICKAYLSLLTDKEFCRLANDTFGDMSYADLWPDVDRVSSNSNCSPLFHAFYRALVRGINGTQQPAVFMKSNQAFMFDEVVFMSPDIPDEVRSDVAEVLKSYIVPNGAVFDISEKTKRSFEKAGLNEIQNRTYNLQRFYEEVFPGHISNLRKQNRDRLVLFALKSHDVIRCQLKNTDCIPVSEDDTLKNPKDLVNPKSLVARMFSKSDRVFPHGEEFNSGTVIRKLVELGMAENTIQEETLYERCHSIVHLHSDDPQAAIERCEAVLKYISDTLHNRRNTNASMKQTLMGIPFLPVAVEDDSREKRLPWKCREDCPRYSSASIIYPYSKRHLVSSVSLILETSRQVTVPWNVSNFLELEKKKPSCQDVLKQLSNFREYYQKNRANYSEGDAEQICHSLYEYIEEVCEKGSSQELNELEDLQESACFLVADRFVLPSQLAMKGEDFRPYLFKVPKLVRKFPKMCARAEVREDFSSKDYQHVLEDVYQTFQTEVLGDEQLELVIKASHSLVETSENVSTELFLPDERGVMRHVSELSFFDVHWVEGEHVFHKCHNKITRLLAEKLGVKDVRQKMLERYELTAEEFGQQESLTSRISSILESYPNDETILKELLQNADDAGATELHFVYDGRKHGDEKVFSSTFGRLQGPALCVFNNQKFSDEDIHGIQQLGKGSKGDLMESIGRFGVGFNAVFHLTDCPSFISNGEKLCLFDPLLKYVPGASVERPGRLFRIDNDLRRTYPDTFSCYMEDELKNLGEDFTVFRFPLRTEKSDLNSNTWNYDKIRKLLKCFEKAALGSLLFLKNVKKIAISEVKEKGAIVPSATFTVEMTTEDNMKKDKFFKHVSDVIVATGKGEGLDNVGSMEVTYEINLKEGHTHERWMITQRVGGFPDFYKENEVAIMRTHKLVPVGGVAACLSGRHKVDGRAYCFLPLPIATKLPVHVHGYFALDNTNRRHLWKRHEQDERTRWNCQLLKFVVAPAYMSLLTCIRDSRIRECGWEMHIPDNEYKYTLQRLSAYHNYFPREGSDDTWNELVTNTYQRIVDSEIDLFPALRHEPPQNQWFVEWKSPISVRDKSQGFFNTLDAYYPQKQHDSRSLGYVQRKREHKSEVDELKDVLIRLGFPLLESPTWMTENLEKAISNNNGDTKVFTISPKSVMSYLYKDLKLHEKLPASVKDTEFQDVQGLKRVIDFCKKYEKFYEELEGLPLLLTNDNILRKFSSDCKVYHSEFCDLFRDQNQKFLHRDLYYMLTYKKGSMFLQLDMTVVAGLLHECTPYLISDKYMSYKKELPLEWFVRLWVLLEELSSEKQNVTKILGDFAILPAVPQDIHDNWPMNCHNVRLVPVKLMPTVLPSHLRHTQSGNYDVVHTLRAYVVSQSFLDKLRYNDQNYSTPELRTKNLIINLLAKINIPQSFLDVLLHCAKTDNKFSLLNHKQREHILCQFAGETDLGILCKLKQLPCFQTCSGKYVTIKECNLVYVLPITIPQIDLERWITDAEPVFLQYISSLECLHQRLGLSSGNSVIEIYTRYILPAFSLLTEEGRMQHMKKLQELLSYMDPKNREIVMGKLCLHSLHFISVETGELKRASDLFDPEVDVFKKILTPCSFPPETYQSRLGLGFLRKIGLRHDVPKNMFLTFAKDIEDSIRVLSKPHEIKNKTYALVRHMENDCNLHKDDSFMKEVRDIKFLVCDKISEHLKAIHPPRQTNCTKYNGSTICSHNHLVWTQENLLPGYANLSKCRVCKKEDFYKQLGVAEEPALTSVITNTQNVCNSMKQRCEDDRIRDHAVQTNFMKVLDTTFEFFRQKCTNNGECTPNNLCDTCKNIAKELKNVPVVFIERDHKLVKADQISRTVRKSLEPYVYQVPDRLGPIFWILTILGATNEPTISQYAFILKSLHDIEHVEHHPRLTELVQFATVGLFEELSTATADRIEAAGLTQLFLPSRNNALEISCKLYVCDFELFTDRMEMSDLPLLKVFEGQESLVKDALVKLPQELRPQPISGKVKEVLFGLGNDSRICYLSELACCEFQDRLTGLIHSQEFTDAIECILKYKRRNIDDTTILRFNERLSSLRVICMQRLQSVLQVDSTMVQKSEAQIKCLVKDKTELYVKHSEDGDSEMETVLAISAQINFLLENTIQGNELFVLPALLNQKSPETMKDVLQVFNITINVRQDTSFKLPPPGTTVPDAILHLIEQDMWITFQVGEYVAFSKTEYDDVVYVYARIVEYLHGVSIQAKYIVDVGGKQIQADAIDLYRIHIPKAMSGKALVPFNGNPSEEHKQQNTALPSDIDDARRRITAEVQEIWKFPPHQRKKAILRLMLKWHPDKHPEGSKALYEEAFKHLRYEIERREENVSERNTHKDIFKEARQRASDDQHRFSCGGGFSSGRWTGNLGNAHFFFRSASVAPDRRNARRWLLQAKEDLRATGHDLSPNDDKPSYEWVAYKCHQAVEKALKSAMLAIRGEHDFSHNILSLACYVKQEMNIADSVFMDNVQRLALLVSDQGTRYPDKCAFSSIPHDLFNNEDNAKSACKLAKEIIDTVSTFLKLDE